MSGAAAKPHQRFGYLSCQLRSWVVWFQSCLLMRGKFHRQASFDAARGLFRQRLRRGLEKNFQTWVQEAFQWKGWPFVAFIRQEPVFPTGPLNYLFGLNSIAGSLYIRATAVSLTFPSIAMS
jgi:hypothetical protein